MTPADLLAAALADRLIIWLEGADTLRVRGPAAARTKWVDVLRRHKSAMLRHMLVERLRDYFEGRAAILEYEAGLPRPEAEEQARRATALLARNLKAPWTALREADCGRAPMPGPLRSG
jgi:hypothetical protein